MQLAARFVFAHGWVGKHYHVSADTRTNGCLAVGADGWLEKLVRAEGNHGRAFAAKAHGQNLFYPMLWIVLDCDVAGVALGARAEDCLVTGLFCGPQDQHLAARTLTGGDVFGCRYQG